uniref:COMM domain containing 2 n=1 Tax=Junco hyemalis TaxID=40217 RepID=A0A8C5IDM1_JUNHY
MEEQARKCSAAARPERPGSLAAAPQCSPAARGTRPALTWGPRFPGGLGRRHGAFRAIGARAGSPACRRSVAGGGPGEPIGHGGCHSVAAGRTRPRQGRGYAVAPAPPPGGAQRLRGQSGASGSASHIWGTGWGMAGAHLGHVLGHIWGMVGAWAGVHLGHGLGYIWGMGWGTGWGTSGARAGARLSQAVPTGPRMSRLPQAVPGCPRGPGPAQAPAGRRPFPVVAEPRRCCWCCRRSIGLTWAVCRGPAAQISEVDFQDSINVLGFSDELNKSLLQLYLDNRKEIRSILGELAPRLPSYHSLEWRLDVQLASRSLRQQIKPAVTMKLHLNQNEDRTAQVLQTDPATLLHLIQQLEQALGEMKMNHCRRIVRNMK